MTHRQRTIRTRPRNGLAISDVLTSVLVSELLDPSPEIWLVTGWVSDIVVVENDSAEFAALSPNMPSSGLTLSDALVELMLLGSNLHIAVREDAHNLQFIERMSRRYRGSRLSVYSSPDLHEKLFCGWDWLMKGSMNFTWNGVSKNEESIDVVLDDSEVARQRLELHTRWRGVSA